MCRGDFFLVVSQQRYFKGQGHLSHNMELKHKKTLMYQVKHFLPYQKSTLLLSNPGVKFEKPLIKTNNE